MPWAVHGAGFTRAFEEQVAWLAVEGTKSAVARLMRIAWRTVGRILDRLSNALVEAVNTRIHLLTRRAFGFHPSKPLIALAMLSVGGC